MPADIIIVEELLPTPEDDIKRDFSGRAESWCRAMTMEPDYRDRCLELVRPACYLLNSIGRLCTIFFSGIRSIVARIRLTMIMGCTGNRLRRTMPLGSRRRYVK